jgi:hypothetical protein
MQAVIRGMLGTSWPQSRMASPVHICCASDVKARVGWAERAVAAQATAKRSAMLLVRQKVIDLFPRVACGAGRCSLGALQAVCAAARVIHHRKVTRCGCSISTDVRIESAAPPRANYALMLESCNGSHQHFRNCCDRATSSEAQSSDNSALTRSRFAEVGVREKERMWASAPPLPTGLEQRCPHGVGLAVRSPKLRTNAENSSARTTTR